MQCVWRKSSSHEKALIEFTLSRGFHSTLTKCKTHIFFIRPPPPLSIVCHPSLFLNTMKLHTVVRWSHKILSVRCNVHENSWVPAIIFPVFFTCARSRQEKLNRSIGICFKCFHPKTLIIRQRLSYEHRFGGRWGVGSVECGECGVWKMRSVENLNFPVM